MRRMTWAWAGAWLAMGGSAVAQLGDPMTAVWRERRVEFVYQGRTMRYSCDGLRDKVRAMLLDLGARRDLTVQAHGCTDDGRNLSIVFASPVLPDDAAQAAHLHDLAATPARFEPFAIASDAFRNMGAADCELVAEFARQILPKLTTRHVRQDISCASDQANRNQFRVHGEILKAAPLQDS